MKNTVSNVTQVTLDGINRGMYFITVENNNNRMTKRVIIK